jgi:hypothetical protein
MMGVAELGSFESWSRIVPAAIVWAGGADIKPASVGGERSKRNVDDAALQVLLENFGKLDDRGRGLTVGAIIRRVWQASTMPAFDQDEDADEAVMAIKEIFDELLNVPPGKSPSPQDLGHRFHRWKDRWLEDRSLHSPPGKRHGVAIWKVVARPKAPAQEEKKGGLGGQGGPFPRNRMQDQES